jgi:hypothetical protein
MRFPLAFLLVLALIGLKLAHDPLRWYVPLEWLALLALAWQVLAYLWRYLTTPSAQPIRRR